MRHPELGGTKIQSIVYQLVIKYIFLSDEIRKQMSYLYRGASMLRYNKSKFNKFSNFFGMVGQPTKTKSCSMKHSTNATDHEQLIRLRYLSEKYNII